MPNLRQGGVYRLRILPSGYDFLGPGNEVLYNVPRNYNDVIAKLHDVAYGELQRRGINPYITFSKADQHFIDNLKPDDIPTIFANYVFRGKKWLAENGILDTGQSLIYHASQSRLAGWRPLRSATVRWPSAHLSKRPSRLRPGRPSSF